MPKKEYVWAIGEKSPIIQPHSRVKHRILSEYLVRYVQVVVPNPRQDELYLALVDGFAGGGLYREPYGDIVHHGSPFQMLNAMREAEALINVKRTKPFRLQCKYFFVDSNPQNLAFLKHTLTKEGYESRFGQDIFLLEGEFAQRCDQIVADLTRERRRRRVLFLLDQYGYKDVPFPLLRGILSRLPYAEIILTFAIDSLINYLGDTPAFQTTLNQIGIAHYIDWQNLERLKRTHNSRFVIQSQFLPALLKESGATFFNPFFIRATESHRDYWLVHLCNHYRARDVMNQLHWNNHTYFRHYGGPGLNMLGYDLNHDSELTGQEVFAFDDTAYTRALTALNTGLAKRIFARTEGIAFGEILSLYCNETPANERIFREVLANQLAHKEIEINGPNGELRRTAQAITLGDRITPARQSYFPFRIK